jgi:hypothetical protein
MELSGFRDIMQGLLLFPAERFVLKTSLKMTLLQDNSE